MGYIPTMPSFRFSLILAACCSSSVSAQEPTAPVAPAPVAPLSDSGRFCLNVLTESGNKLRAMPRIAAKIVEEVDMLNQKFTLEGHYYKDGDLKVRFELNLKGLGEANSTLLQVCDGKVLWEFNKIPSLNLQSYRRRDILPIIEKLKDPNLDDTFRAEVNGQLGFGGPVSLLMGFREKVTFDQFADETIDGVGTFVLGGSWTNRKGLIGPNDRPLPDTAPLPSYIPSSIRVFVEKATLWPYRIEMVGKAASMLQEDTRQVGPDGRPIGVKKAPPKVDPSRITLRYTLMAEDATEFDKQFKFQPPREAANQVEDDTEQFLGQIDKIIQYQMNQKKAEAAKAESEAPLLKTPLDLPIGQPGATPPTSPMPATPPK